MPFQRHALTLFFGAISSIYSFNISPTLSAVPDNTAKELGRYTCGQPVASPYYCEAITDYSGFTYDPNNHQMLMFGGGHSSTFRDDVDVFNFATLKWAPAYNSTACAEMVASNLDVDKGMWTSTGHPFSRHTYDLLAVTGNTGEFLMMRSGGGTSSICQQYTDWYPSGRVAHYDPQAKTWSYGAAMGSLWSNLASSEFDPVSGLVIVLSEQSTTGLWTYDPVSKIATRRLPVSNLPGYANNLIYYPPNQKMYFMASGSPVRVFEVTLNRQNWASSTVSEVTGISGSAPSVGETGWAYDSVHRIIGGGVSNGKFFALDPVAKTWDTRTMAVQSTSQTSIGSQAFHAIDYDPVDNVFLFITGGRYTWAYRYAPTGTEESASGGKGQRVKGKGVLTVSPNPIRGGGAARITASGNARVYDSNGRRIAVLSGNSPAWETRGVPAGVYLIRAEVDGRSVEKRVTVLR